jgi:DNA polymerase-3 subunit gamma/tau
MSYEVLALKYRPKIFEDLVGQEAVTRTLTHAIQQGRLAHAFLFSGVRGVGKTTTARILAKALNCASGPTVRPCGECPACTEIARGGSLDVLEIDGASNNGVEQVRDIIDASRYAPSRDRFKIYIIDEVHMLTTAAFNALLKTLEEPPPSVKFIFATTEHHKIPDTILSRCQEFEFRTVSPTEIGAQLRKIASSEGIEIGDAALAAISRAAEGSMRDGISALDQVIAATGTKVEESDVTELLGLIERDVLRDTTRAILNQDTGAILKTVDGLVRTGRDLRYFTSALMQYLRDVLVVRVAPSSPELLEVPGETSHLEELSKELTEEDLLRSLDVLTQAESALRTSPEPRFHLEMALLKISQLRRLAGFEELVARFEALIDGATPPTPTGATPAPTNKTGRGEATAESSTRSRSAPASSERSAEASGENNWTDDVPPLGESAPVRPVDPHSAGAAGDDEFVSQLMEQLKALKPMLHALVSRHHRAELAERRLTLFFLPEQQAIAEQLEHKELKALLETQASQLAGRRVFVSIDILQNGQTPMKAHSEETTAPSPASGAKEETPSNLLERAQKDPMVRRFVETFQGEIQSVRPPSNE